MSSPVSITALLEQLAIPSTGIVYVQSSADWIQRAGFTPTNALSELRTWVGSRGTLVMPSYPFHSTHLAYMEQSPKFDVRRTPSAVGLLTEMWRRTPGVIRSLDPDFPIAAAGPDAVTVVGEAPSSEDPFGRDSSYARILERDATLVGLGVSLNTNSFIHAIDARHEAGYPARLYFDERRPAIVIDGDGEERRLLRRVLKPSSQQRIKPSAINDVMRPGADVFRMVDINGARFFAWRLRAWRAWCEAHVTALSGEWPCWLTQLAEAA